MTRLLKISTPAVLFVGLLVGLVVGMSGCNSVKPGKPNNEQLAALDEAYKSGVFTKEEYDAKKAAIVAASAASATPATSAAPPVSSTQAPPPDSSGSTPIASAEPAPVPAFPEPSLPPQAPPANQPAPPPQPQPVPTPAPVKTAPAPRPTTVAKAVPPTTGQAEPPEPEPAPSRQCEDAEYKAHKNGPQERFFPAPVARVKKALLSALTNLDFTVHKDSGDEIEASKNRHIGVVVGAGGEREILHFEAAKQGGQSGTLVTGETKKSVVGRLAQKSWTGAVLAEAACTLRK